MKNVFEQLEPNRYSENGLTLFYVEIDVYGEDKIRDFYKEELIKYPHLEEVFTIYKDTEHNVLKSTPYIRSLAEKIENDKAGS